MADIVSGANSDILDGGSGSDRLNGGSGSDSLIYNLFENAGATDLYTGGSGIDTLKLELTVSDWESWTVQQEIREYLQHLATVKTNVNTGEVSNGTANDFAFDSGSGTTLTVSMIEKLGGAVNREAMNPVAPVNDAQVTDLNGAVACNNATTAFTEQAPVLIASTATITDVDPANLTSLAARPDGNAVESLSLNGAATSVVTDLKVKCPWSTGPLSISGSSTNAIYPSILDGIQYNNPSDMPTTIHRSLNAVVSDGTDDGTSNG